MENLKTNLSVIDQTKPNFNWVIVLNAPLYYNGYIKKQIKNNQQIAVLTEKGRRIIRGISC